MDSEGLSAEVVAQRKAKFGPGYEPTFRDPATMTHEELTDPDYALKQLEKLGGGLKVIGCSKCHHCR